MGNRFFCTIQRSRNGWDIPSPVARGMEDSCSLPGQDLLCLPGDWLHSSHVALG